MKQDKNLDYVFLNERINTYKEIADAFEKNLELAKQEIINGNLLDKIEKVDGLMYSKLKIEISRCKYIRNALATIIYIFDNSKGIILSEDLKFKTYSEFIAQIDSANIENKKMLNQFLMDGCLSHIFKGLNTSNQASNVFWNMIIQAEEASKEHGFILGYLSYVSNYKRLHNNSSAPKEVDNYVYYLLEKPTQAFYLYEKLKTEKNFLSFIAYEYGLENAIELEDDAINSLPKFLALVEKDVSFDFSDIVTKSPVAHLIKNIDKYSFYGTLANRLKAKLLAFSKDLNCENTNLSFCVDLLSEGSTLYSKFLSIFNYSEKTDEMKYGIFTTNEDYKFIYDINTNFLVSKAYLVDNDSFDEELNTPISNEILYENIKKVQLQAIERKEKDIEEVSQDIENKATMYQKDNNTLFKFSFVGLLISIAGLFLWLFRSSYILNFLQTPMNNNITLKYNISIDNIIKNLTTTTPNAILSTYYPNASTYTGFQALGQLIGIYAVAISVVLLLILSIIYLIKGISRTVKLNKVKLNYSNSTLVNKVIVAKEALSKDNKEAIEYDENYFELLTVTKDDNDLKKVKNNTVSQRVLTSLSLLLSSITLTFAIGYLLISVFRVNGDFLTNMYNSLYWTTMLLNFTFLAIGVFIITKIIKHKNSLYSYLILILLDAIVLLGFSLVVSLI